MKKGNVKAGGPGRSAADCTCVPVTVARGSPRKMISLTHFLMSSCEIGFKCVDSQSESGLGMFSVYINLMLTQCNYLLT